VEVHPIGFVESGRAQAEDDYWGGESACIALNAGFPYEALEGLAAFSHVEVLYFFHEVDPKSVVVGARRPRDNPRWPAVGIFAQRGRHRPNRLGTNICRLMRVEGTRLHVAELDAIQGTPVLDLKPVMKEFLPRDALRQPRWSHEVMRHYWKARKG
jgi:tRNA (adenine37-N6)-methyltransferase